MLNHSLDIPSGTLYLFPHGRSETIEFIQLAVILRPFVKEYGQIHNLFINVNNMYDANITAFKSFINLLDKDHKSIQKVALIGTNINNEYINEAYRFFHTADVKTFENFDGVNGFSTYHAVVA